MESIPPFRLLETWEAGRATNPARRGHLLHTLAQPDARHVERASVGQRAADLFHLRHHLFGDRMEVVTDCRECGEALECRLDPAALARPPESTTVRVEYVDGILELRLPRPADVEAAAHEASPKRALLRRCVRVTSGQEDSPSRVADCPEEVLRQAAELLAKADPGAETRLDITCPECSGRTSARLDIASFLWSEVDSWARALLTDVHVLARAYGWSEEAIIALTPTRRRYYLELCADA